MSAPAVEASRNWSRLRGPALWLALVGAQGVLLFLYHHLAVLAEGGTESALKPLINELTGALAVGVLFFPIRTLVRRLPLTVASWPRRLAVYLLALTVCGATATTAMWGLRAALYPLAGLGTYDYGAMPLRYLMELPLQAIWFSIVVGALHAWRALQLSRAQELRAIQLEGSLARAQVRNLRLQLQPHFLFNALNTISATMYEDPRGADEMLDQLAELLRASLRTAHTDEVALGEELGLLDRYLTLQRARFGARLAVAIDSEPGTETLLVPSMILQPLIENAIRHGGAERSGHGAVTVRSRRAGTRLRLEVEDDGEASGAPDPGAANRHGTGFGLAATAERLRLLYGDDHAFAVGRIGGTHGFQVRIELPARRAEAP